MILPKLWPLSLEFLSSSEPHLHLSQPLTLSSNYAPLPIPAALSISTVVTPPPDSHHDLFSLLPLGLRLHPSFGTQSTDPATFFLSPTPYASSLLSLPSSGAWINHSHHSFASPLVLLYSLGQTRTSTLVKCNTQPTLVPVLTNLNVARRQQICLMLNSCTGRVWWPWTLPGSHTLSPCPLALLTSKQWWHTTCPQSLQKPWLLIH